MGSVGGLDYDRPWRLALIIDDKDALKVAVAYYTLPKKQRNDLEKLAEMSGVEQGVTSILTRLRGAGILDHDEPPKVLDALVTQHVNSVLSRRG